MIEQEKKYKLHDPKSVDAKLLELGFKKKSEKQQKDTYYTRADVDFMVTMECLRIREEHGFIELTYKPESTKEMINNKSIWKKETNLTIQDLQRDDAHTFLELLGCKALCVVDKNRTTYYKDSVNVAIDNVKNLGYYLELEVLTHQRDEEAINLIEITAKQLGIKANDSIGLPYRDLLMNAS